MAPALRSRFKILATATAVDDEAAEKYAKAGVRCLMTTVARWLAEGANGYAAAVSSAIR